MKAFATAIAVIALAFQGYAAPATSIISISEMNKRFVITIRGYLVTRN